MVKGAKVRKLPRSGAATRDHLPAGPMPKAMISRPRGQRLRDQGEQAQVVLRLLGHGHHFNDVGLLGQHFL